MIQVTDNIWKPLGKSFAEQVKIPQGKTLLLAPFSTSFQEDIWTGDSRSTS